MSRKPIALITAVLIAVLLCTAGCSNTVSGNGTSAADNTTLLVYSGAGLKTAMTEIGEVFTEKYGIGVDYNFAGSGTLITQMELSRKGDLFIPGGTPDYRIAQGKGLVGEPEYVAYHVPVIVVAPGNPKNITSIEDFARPGLKIALGDASTTAIGRASDKLFQQHGILDAVEANVVLRAPTVNEVAVAMNMGTADAALITFDIVNPETMEVIELPPEEGVVLIVPIGVTTFTEHPDAARLFVEFVTSDEGKAIFVKHGFPAYPDPAYAGIEP